MIKVLPFFVSLMILLRCAPQNNNSTAISIIADAVTIIDTLIIKDTVTISDTRVIYDTTKIIKVDTLTILDTVIISPKRIVTEIIPVGIRADSVRQAFPLTNLNDGIPVYSRANRGTRFALPGYPHWLVFNFDHVVQIDSIEINTYLWNEDYNHTITIFSWGDSLTQFTTRSVLYSGHAIKAVTSQLILRIDSGENNWTDIGEVKFFTTDYSTFGFP